MSRRREISSIVVVTPEGRLYARPQAASANTRTMLRALPYFRRQLGRPLLIIWDRLNAHRSRAVLQFVASHAGDYALAYLPAYAPELNSEEQANAWVERRMANALPQRSPLWPRSPASAAVSSRPSQPSFATSLSMQDSTLRHKREAH